MKKITIFTPTYNRKKYLNSLYESLVRQTYKNFEWIIVDDGSIDDTEIQVSSFINEKKIDILYFFKENGGKHTCINKGIDLASGDLFFIVDSDDFLTDDALERIIYWEKTIDLDLKHKYIGLAGLRMYHNGEVIGGKLKKIYIDASPAELRYKYKIKGDKAEVFYTEMLKQYKFPIIDKKEKFLTEGVIYNEMSKNNLLIRWFNEGLYYTEYLPGGLTMSGKDRCLENWSGYTYYYNQILELNIPLIEKIRHLSNYYRIGLNKFSLYQMYKNINNKIISLVCMPLGFFYYLKDKRKKIYE